jgi:hypothetical protein
MRPPPAISGEGWRGKERLGRGGACVAESLTKRKELIGELLERFERGE